MKEFRYGKALAAGCAMLVALAACQGRAGEQQATLAHNASVTVYPVGMLGRPNEQVGKVVAMLLERGGLDRVELASPAFAPGAATEFDAERRAFAKFAAGQALRTDYALYGEYVGTPRGGVREVRGVLVDGRGRVVWSECQKPGDPAFDRAKPKDPMSCTVLLVDRLRGPLGLADPFGKKAPKSGFEERMKRESGVPDKREFDAMKARVAKLRASGGKATMVVFPAHVGNEYSSEAANAIARSIDEQQLASAKAADGELQFEFQPAMNEQTVLWSAARSIQETLRAHPVDADYVLVAHYVVAPDNPGPFGVHTFVFDRKGDFVIVDFQNSHHNDFQRLQPTTAANRTKLTVLRLESCLK